MRRLITILLFMAVAAYGAAYGADGDPLSSNFGKAGANVDTNAELGGVPLPNANTTTTAVVNCSVGSLTSTAITLTSATNFDTFGGIASICRNVSGAAQCTNFTYTSISGLTMNGVATSTQGNLPACTGNYAAGSLVQSLTTLTTLAPSMRVLQQAIQNTQKTVGVKVVTPASLGVTTLAAAVAVIGATATVLRIDSTLPYGAVTTVPATLTLDLSQGMIDCNNTAAAADIRGPLIAPQKQIFINCITNSGVSFASNKVVQEVNPLWWGAVGDDATDSTLPIQRAVDALPSSFRGGVVLIPPGTYKTTAKITLKSGITLAGAGMLQSVLKAYGNEDALYAVYPQASYLRIADLQVFDGLGIGPRTLGHAIHIDGTASDASHDRIESVYIIGFENGVDIKRGAYNSLRNVRVASCEQDGIALSVVSTIHTTMDTTYVVGCSRYGYRLSDVNFGTFLNTTSDGNGSDGYYVETGVGNMFFTPTSEQNTGHGYHLVATDQVVFDASSAVKLATGKDGYFFEGARFVTLNGPIASGLAGSRYCINVQDSTIPVARTATDLILFNQNFSGCTSGIFNVVRENLLMRYAVNVFSRLAVASPAAEAISSNGIITADACGAVKRLTSSGDITTNSGDPFTPVGSVGPCEMMLLNTNVTGAITIPSGTNFRTFGSFNITLQPNDRVSIVGTGSGGNWYQASLPVRADGDVFLRRMKATLGTALVAGDFALSAGWGATASVGTITGTDQRWQATFTSSGTGQGASPTITLTYKDLTWTTIPIVVVARNGGTGTGITGFTWFSTATALTITAVGTPIAGETYQLSVMTLG